MLVIDRRLLVALTATSLMMGASLDSVCAQPIEKNLAPSGANHPRVTAEERIRAALGKPCKVAYYNAPLAIVIRDLATMNAINIHLDAKSIDDVGLSGDAEVTLTVNEVSLRSALGLLLDQHDLTWTIRHETLLITTSEAAEANLRTRVYRVRDLVAQVDDPLAEAAGDDTLAEAVDFDSLIEVITATVSPHTWEEVGGPGAIDSFRNGTSCALVVSQTDLVHEQIEELLVELRAAEREAARIARRENVGEPSQNIGKPRITVAVYPIIKGDGPSVEELAELVREVVGQDEWNGESGTAVRGVAQTLVVRHNQAVHRQVQQTLQKIGVLDSSLYPLGPYYSGK